MNYLIAIFSFFFVACSPPPFKFKLGECELSEGTQQRTSSPQEVQDAAQKR